MTAFSEDIFRKNGKKRKSRGKKILNKPDSFKNKNESKHISFKKQGEILNKDDSSSQNNESKSVFLKKEYDDKIESDKILSIPSIDKINSPCIFTCDSKR